MKKIIPLLMIILSIQACDDQKDFSSVDPVNWKKRSVAYVMSDSLMSGITYLSVYSSIYSLTEKRTHDLTATVSMRNTSRVDSIFIDKAEYFDTKGQSIRTYFDQTIFIAPMETVEIVIDEIDQAGGTGGNFLFDWKIKPRSNEPLFESIMISEEILCVGEKGRRSFSPTLLLFTHPLISPPG